MGCIIAVHEGPASVMTRGGGAMPMSSLAVEWIALIVARSYRLVVLAIALTCCLGAPRPAESESVTVPITDAGWWTSSGTSNQFSNYLAGFNNGDIYRNYFVFDLSSVTGTILSATLQISAFQYHSPDPSETFALFDVSTPIQQLERTFGTQGTGIYQDLGSGTL